MRVRRLERREDVAEAIRVNNEAWRAAYDDLLPEEVVRELTGDPSEEMVDSLFERRREHRDGFLVAEDDGGVVRGYAYFRWGDDETKEFVGPDEAGLKEIYVEPDYWGRGIGATLLERGLEILPDDTTALKLEMLSGNRVGERFYEARGFERTGTAEEEIGGDVYRTDIYALWL